MLVVLAIILSVGFLGLMVYFAFSPKSSRVLRLSALAALGLIGLALGVCGIFLIRGPVGKEADVPLPLIFSDSPPPARESNLMAIIIFLVVFLFVMGMMIAVFTRVQKKQGAAEKTERSPVRPIREEMKAAESNTKKSGIKEFDESFDIDL